MSGEYRCARKAQLQRLPVFLIAPIASLDDDARERWAITAERRGAFRAGGASGPELRREPGGGGMAKFIAGSASEDDRARQQVVLTRFL